MQLQLKKRKLSILSQNTVQDHIHQFGAAVQRLESQSKHQESYRTSAQ
jgi:hypothetical protein